MGTSIHPISAKRAVLQVSPEPKQVVLGRAKPPDEPLKPPKADEKKGNVTPLHQNTPRPLQRLHHYFEQSCDQHPEKEALHYDGVSLSYAELDKRSNRLAHYLRKAYHLQSGARVAILMERSIDMYIALLSILKCGATFVPIDPSVPRDRMIFVIVDSEASLLISISALSELSAGVPCSVLILDKLGQELKRLPKSRPFVKETSDALCYIIYTSGTTGRPKGVGIRQSKICNFISVVTLLYGFKPSDRVYQGISISFDFSIEEIWTTFAIGATLVPGPTDHRHLGSGLRQYLDENEITVLCCVPTLLSTIDCDLPKLRTVIVGGEACPEDLVRRWSREGRVMLNTYGPTETTVTASMARLVPDHKVTIGKPLPSYTMHILDENLNPVSDGEVGEIFIGGIGVADGYIHRPDKTSECFLVNNLEGHGRDEERLYRTGDLGRLTADGEVEYFGRCDSQVKIRGHRIELAEVESVLLENKVVESAVVNLVEVGSNKELVAYIVLRNEDQEGEEKIDMDTVSVNLDGVKTELYKQLCSRLPRYEMPSFLEVLDAIPTLPSGKINRRYLPPPSSSRFSACSQATVQPETALERQLVEVWKTIFGVDDVSVLADFFEDLGGHSLLAAQVVSELRKYPALENLPISDLYAYPTIRCLANHLEDKKDEGSSDALTVKGERDAPIRHSSLKVWMCGIGQLAFVYIFAQVLSIPFSYLVVEKGWHPVLAGLLVGSYALPVAFVLPFIAKFLLIGKYRPGRHPLWGWYYIRWWISTGLIALGPLGLFGGTPFLAPYMRLLGARIGKNCYLGSLRGFLMPDLIEIGENISIGYGVVLETYVVKDGWLYQGQIKIGDNAFIGNNAVVMLGACVGENSCVLEQTLVAADQSVPDGETWAGSPSHRVPSDKALADMSSRRVSQDWTTGEVWGYLLWICLFFLSLLPSLIIGPSVAALWFLGSNGDIIEMTKISPIGGVLYVLSTCLWVAFFKRIILYRTPEGVFPLHSSLGMRKWVTDALMMVSLIGTNSLYATLYTSPWLRAVGAKVGSRAEVSTVSHVDPDLITLNEESFVADIAMMGAARHHHGCIATGRTTVGVRSFVGNAAMIPPGTKIPDNCLIGVLSVPPRPPIEVDPGSNWLGSPAIYLPRRQESPKFNEEVTFRPSRRLIALRLSIEFLRVFLPAVLLSSFGMVGLLTVWWLVEYDHIRSYWLLTSMMPGLFIGIMLAMYLLIVALKWVLVGTYVPHVAPLWSHFVWRSELTTALYENAAVPGLRATLGTPFYGPLMRLLGARIGSRVYCETTYLTEFDLVRVADDSSVGFACSLQTHLFEDRVMKMSYVDLGRGTSLGAKSIVLYDSTIENYTSIDALSLVMKGERIPTNTEWRGIPAQSITRVCQNADLSLQMEQAPVVEVGLDRAGVPTQLLTVGQAVEEEEASQRSYWDDEVGLDRAGVPTQLLTVGQAVEEEAASQRSYWDDEIIQPPLRLTTHGEMVSVPLGLDDTHLLLVDEAASEVSYWDDECSIGSYWA